MKKRAKTVKKGQVKWLMDKDQTVKKIDEYIKKKNEITKFERTYMNKLQHVSDNGSDLEVKNEEIMT